MRPRHLVVRTVQLAPDLHEQPRRLINAAADKTVLVAVPIEIGHRSKVPLYCKLLNIVVFIQLPKMNGTGVSIRKQGGLIEHLRSKVGVLVASHGAKCPDWLPLLADLFRRCPDDNTEVEAAAH